MGRPMLVSVVIPTFNHAQFVTEAVESALSQTYQPLEVIVVDDGSTDETKSVLAPYVGRIQYVRQENRGLSAARNVGIGRASGEWIALLDADDLWSPHKIQLQVEASRANPELTLIGGRGGATDQFSAPVGDLAVREFTVLDFLTSTPFGPSAAMVRRDLFSTIGCFDEELSPVADRDFWLRAAAASRVGRIEWPCWHYRRSAGQMSRNADYMYFSFQKLVRKFFIQHAAYAAHRSVAYGFLYRDAAWSYYEQGERIKALGFLFKSAARYPALIPHSKRFQRTKMAVRFIKGPFLEPVYKGG